MRKNTLSVNITMTVGYCWSNSAAWSELKKFLHSVAEEASRRWSSKTVMAVQFEETENEPTADLAVGLRARAPRCTIQRLRAGAGRFAWVDITERITNSDVVVFDITPPRHPKKTRDNVMLELGYALAIHREDSVPVLVTAHNCDTRHLEFTPSDLHGLILTSYGKTPRAGRDKVADRSLRMTLINALMRAFDRKANATSAVIPRRTSLVSQK